MPLYDHRIAELARELADESISDPSPERRQALRAAAAHLLATPDTDPQEEKE